MGRAEANFVIFKSTERTLLEWLSAPWLSRMVSSMIMMPHEIERT